MQTRKGFTLIELLVVISIIALLIGILLPALGAARRAARQMTNSTQVRGIGQAMMFFAEENGGYYPGLNSDGELYEDDANGNDTGDAGGSVAVRFELMLDRNSFAGDYIISPSDGKIEWTTDGVDTTYYSYAMLKITDINTSNTTTPRLPNNNAGRLAEWGGSGGISLSSQALIMADRAKGNDTSDLYSVHTKQPAPGDGPNWRGTIGWNDNHVKFSTTEEPDTKYDFHIAKDHLFEEVIENGGIDGSETWDTESNALMVYEDHDIVYSGDD